MKTEFDKQNYERIRDYYQRVSDKLDSNNFNIATNILYIQMPVLLYDISLDILENTNEDFYDIKLRELVLSVNKRLDNYSQEDELDIDSEIPDFFNENIF